MPWVCGLPHSLRRVSSGQGYGRFRFKEEKVVKWNCVFREAYPTGVPARDYSYRCYVLVGSLKNVTDTINALHQRSPPIDKDKN